MTNRFSPASHECSAAQPLVSLIMPVYNRKQMTQRAVESILRQTDPGWELVVVDDCSTDGVEDLLRAYAADERRIRSIRNARNSGPAVSRNTALDLSCGEYVAFLDNDDFLSDDFVEKVRAASRDCDADLLIFEYDLVDIDGAFLRMPKAATVDGKPCLFGMYSNPNIARLYRRSVLETHRVRYPVGKLCEDAMWSLATNCLFTRVAAFPATVYHNTVHDGSLSRNAALYAALGMQLLPLEDFSRLIAYTRSQSVCSHRDTFAYFCLTFGFLGCFLYSRGIPLKELRLVTRAFRDSLAETAAEKNAYAHLLAWREPMIRSNIRLVQHAGATAFRHLLRWNTVYPFAALNNLLYRMTHRKA